LGVPRNSLNTFSGRLFGELVAAIAELPPVVVSADSMAWGVKRQWTQRRPEAKAQRGEAQNQTPKPPDSNAKDAEVLAVRLSSLVITHNSNASAPDEIPKAISSPKPKVARNELSWVHGGSDSSQPQRGCGFFRGQRSRNPVGDLCKSRSWCCSGGL